MYPRLSEPLARLSPPPPSPQIEEAKGTSALPAPEEAAATTAATAKAAAPAAPKFEAVPIGKWEPVAADTQRENGNGGAGGVAGAAGGAAAAATAAAATEIGSSAAGVFGVGARVEVLSGDKWYPAVSAVFLFRAVDCRATRLECWRKEPQQQVLLR